jgi:hypothetical protein
MSDTTLTISDEVFAEGEALGFSRAQLEHALAKSIADGITQEQLDKDVEAAFENARAAKKANDEARQEQEAEVRKANRAAFAGMALQGILSREYHRPKDAAAIAVRNADALLKALDEEPSDEE